MALNDVDASPGTVTQVRSYSDTYFFVFEALIPVAMFIHNEGNLAGDHHPNHHDHDEPQQAHPLAGEEDVLLPGGVPVQKL